MLNKLHIITGSFLILVLIVGGCTINTTLNAGSNPITEQDLLAATQILGTSISAANNGAVLSISDALTIIANNNANVSTNIGSQSIYNKAADKSNYAHEYNPETGIHTVSFNRNIETPFFNNSEIDTAKYIYKNSEDVFIQYPLEKPEQIASVHYIGWRKGKTVTLHKEVSYTRKDTLLITGFNNTNSELDLEGAFYDQGTFILTDSGDPKVMRSYNLALTYLDLNILKPALNNSSLLAKKMTGAISWVLTYKNGPTMRGTVELVGDGTALMRFQNNTAVYQINLNNGMVKNLSEAFTGRIAKVNLAAQQFQLLNGLTVQLYENTVINAAGFKNLQAVQDTINNNIYVWAEGFGTLQNSRFNAANVVFSHESINGIQAGFSFEEPVTAVNLMNQTFTVAGQVSIRVTDQTAINKQGDYVTLEEVKQALDEKQSNTAVGTVLDTATADEIIATNVIFYKNR